MNDILLSTVILYLGTCDYVLVLSGIINNEWLRFSLIIFLTLISYFEKIKIPYEVFIYVLLMLFFDISISFISLVNNSHYYNILASSFQGITKRIIIFYLPILLFSGFFQQFEIGKGNVIKSKFIEIYMKISMIFCIQIIIYTFLQILNLDLPGIPMGVLDTGSIKLTFVGIVYNNFQIWDTSRPQGVFSEANYLAMFLLPSFFLSIKGFSENKFKSFFIFLSIALTGSISVMFGLIMGIIFLSFKYSKSIAIFLITTFAVSVPNLYLISIGEIENDFLSNFLIENKFLYRLFLGREFSAMNKLGSIEWAIENIPDFGLGVLNFSQINEYFSSPDIMINTAGAIFSLYIQYGKLFFIPYLLTVIFIVSSLYKNRFSESQWIIAAITFSIMNSTFIHSAFHKTFLAIFVSLLITESFSKKSSMSTLKL